MAQASLDLIETKLFLEAEHELKSKIEALQQKHLALSQKLPATRPLAEKMRIIETQLACLTEKYHSDYGAERSPLTMADLREQINTLNATSQAVRICYQDHASRRLSRVERTREYQEIVNRTCFPALEQGFGNKSIGSYGSALTTTAASVQISELPQGGRQWALLSSVRLPFLKTDN